MSNEYDALIPQASPEAQAQKVTNEYDALVVDFTKERQQRTRASILSAQDANPDLTAKALTLSKKTGIPVDTVERDVKAVEGPAALNDYDALVQKSPGLGKWLEEPINARVAKDDYENLGLIEKGWNEIKRGFYGQRTGAQALGATVAGQRMADLEAAKGKSERGEYLTPVEKSMLAQAPQAQANAEAASTEAIDKILSNRALSDALPMRPALREMNDAKTWGEAWSALAKDPLGIIFDLSVQNVPQLATTTAATLLGGPATGVAVTGAQSFGMEFVSGILDNMQELGVNTSDRTALRAAFSNPELMAEVYRRSTIKASIVGTLDAATMGIASKTIAPKAATSALTKQAFNMPAQLGIQMAGGAGGEALGSLAAGNEIKPGAVLAESVAELGGTPAEVAAMRNHIGKPKAPVSPEVQQATVQAAGLDKLVLTAQASKLATRSPEKLAEFLSTVTGPDQNVFIPAETVQGYFQSLPLEDAKAQADALGLTEQLPEALARGGDVVIPLAKYVTEAGKSDLHKAWREDVRMEADGFSIRQAQEDAKVKDERLKLAVDRFEKQLDAGIAEVDAVTRVYEDIRDKLKTLGQFTNEAAEQQAALFAERYQARAARNPGSYLDAWDAYGKAGTGHGLDIQTRLSERVGAYPPDDLDVLLNSIRSGKVAPTKGDADANAQFAKDREELSAALKSMGVDTAKMTNPQVRAAIKAEVEKKGAGKTFEQPVYHGSPHIFDKFDLSKIGTGEGAQAFGHGLYFAGSKAVAQYYRSALSSGQTQWTLGGKTVSFEEAMEAVRQALKPKWDVNKFGSIVANGRTLADIMVFMERGHHTADELRKAYKDVAAAPLMFDTIEATVGLKKAGRLYHVDIPEDGAYLHWDKPFSEQSPEVKKALAPFVEEIKAKLVADASAWGKPSSEEIAGYRKQADGIIDRMTGEKIYRALSESMAGKPADERGMLGWLSVQNTVNDRMANDRAASLALRESGIPGIQYLDAGSRGSGDGSHNYVLFDDSLARIKTYEQEARGQITFTDNRAIITLFQTRDLSTLIHESGHLFLAELEFDARDPNAPEQVKKDWQAVLDWLGSKDGYITREMHEQFARGFEAYAMEGKAPSTALASAFRSFKRWLTQIYKRLASLNAPISPEMRQVFDRLIATDEQIEGAQTRQGLNPIFKDAKSAGMTDAEFAAYTARANAVVDEAEQKLLAKTMEGIRKQRTKEWKADEATVRGEVADEVMADPGQQGLALLTKGALPSGETPEVLKGIKLAKEDVVALYGDEQVLSMIPAGIYRDRASGPGTISPDALAPMLGLDSGKELVERLMQLEAQKRAMAAKGDKRSVARAKIDEDTAQRMNERHGDPLNDGTIEQEAMAAVHSDKQAALMASELRVLANKAGHTGAITWDDIKSWAADAIADKSVKEGTQYDHYARAERQAGSKVERALIKGDFVAAFKAKQDQMVNHALYMEARKASEDVDSARKLMDRYASTETIKNMDQEYLEQIHQLLETYEFKNRSGKFLEERKSFEAWAIEQEAKGFEVIPPPRLDRGLFTINYREMTIDELRGLTDTVKQIAHLGRWKQEMLDGQKKREFEAVVAEAIASVQAIPQRGVSQVRRGMTNLQEKMGDVGSWFRSADAALLKLETVFEWLDGDKTGRGVFQRVIFQRMSEAQTAERDLQKKLNTQLTAIHEKVPLEQRKRWTDVLTLPELGTKLNRSQLIAVALNIGNESNLDKLLRGEKWSEEAVRKTLNDTLTKEEWSFVQDAWDLINSLWPEAEAMERRVNGVAPPKIEALSVLTPHGTLKGGYYPAVYDPKASVEAEKIGALKAEGVFDSNYRRATTRAGSTHKRTGAAYPMLLSLQVIGQHINEISHDIAFREPVMDALRFLGDKRIREVVNEALGPEYSKQFEPWVKNIANEWAIDRKGTEGVEKFMSTLRTNVTAVGMGFRVSTMLSQVAGYANSVQRLGVVGMASGMRAFLKNPAEAARTVHAKSGEMRHRMNDLERDIRAALLKIEGKSGFKADVQRFAFRGIALFDAAVSIPTWISAYNKGLKEGMTDAEASYYGDKMVRDTQGAGAAKDLAAIQRGGPLMKLFTMFYSYFNVFYNRQRSLARDARDIGSVGQVMDVLAQSFWLLIVPSLLAPLLSGQGPGDDEEWGTWVARNLFFGLFSGLPYVRDAANTASNIAGGKGTFGGTKLSPVQTVWDTAFHTGKDVAKIVGGDAPSDTAIKSAFTMGGLLTGLPTGQVGATSQFLWDALVAGSQNPQSLKDWLSGLAYGPERRK